jgi:hypothetical protein
VVKIVGPVAARGHAPAFVASHTYEAFDAITLPGTDEWADLRGGVAWIADPI